VVAVVVVEMPDEGSDLRAGLELCDDVAGRRPAHVSELSGRNPEAAANLLAGASAALCNGRNMTKKSVRKREPQGGDCHAKQETAN
jgi:hypothetical protein